MNAIDQKSILILTKQSRILDGLQALLRTIPKVNIIDQVEKGPTALKVIAKHQPDLLLLVTNFPNEEARWILNRLISDPLPRCLVLTDTLTEKRHAEMLGADEVLLSGFSTDELFESVKRLLSKEN